MKKVHTKAKRMAGVSSGHKHTGYLRNKPTKNGAKSFKTEEAAKKWMQENSKESTKFRVVSAKRGKKFVVKAIL